MNYELKIGDKVTVVPENDPEYGQRMLDAGFYDPAQPMHSDLRPMQGKTLTVVDTQLGGRLELLMVKLNGMPDWWSSPRFRKVEVRYAAHILDGNIRSFMELTAGELEELVASGVKVEKLYKLVEVPFTVETKSTIKIGS